MPMNSKPNPPYLDGWLRGASGKAPSEGRRGDRSYATGYRDGKAALAAAVEAAEKHDADLDTSGKVEPASAIALFQAVQKGEHKR